MLGGGGYDSDDELLAAGLGTWTAPVARERSQHHAGEMRVLVSPDVCCILDGEAPIAPRITARFPRALSFRVMSGSHQSFSIRP